MTARAKADNVAHTDDGQNILLARLDERTKAMNDSLTEIKNDLANTYATKSAIDQLRTEISGRLDALQLRIQFLEKIVYSVAGVVGLAVVSAIVALVLAQPK